MPMRLYKPVVAWVALEVDKKAKSLKEFVAAEYVAVRLYVRLLLVVAALLFTVCGRGRVFDEQPVIGPFVVLSR